MYKIYRYKIKQKPEWVDPGSIMISHYSSFSSLHDIEFDIIANKKFNTLDELNKNHEYKCIINKNINDMLLFSSYGIDILKIHQLIYKYYSYTKQEVHEIIDNYLMYNIITIPLILIVTLFHDNFFMTLLNDIKISMKTNLLNYIKENKVDINILYNIKNMNIIVQNIPTSTEIYVKYIKEILDEQFIQHKNLEIKVSFYNETLESNFFGKKICSLFEHKIIFLDNKDDFSKYYLSELN